MLEYQLRPETPEDIDFLEGLYASTRQTELSVVPWTDEQKTEFLRSQFFLQRKHYYAYYEGASFDVIELNLQRIGRIYVHRNKDYINLMEISLLPEYQKHGIGTSLLTKLFTEARAAKRPVQLHVEQFNPAKHWYEKMGFVVIEERGVYLQMRWEAHDQT